MTRSDIIAEVLKLPDVQLALVSAAVKRIQANVEFRNRVETRFDRRNEAEAMQADQDSIAKHGDRAAHVARTMAGTAIGDEIEQLGGV